MLDCSGPVEEPSRHQRLGLAVAVIEVQTRLHWQRTVRAEFRSRLGDHETVAFHFCNPSGSETMSRGSEPPGPTVYSRLRDETLFPTSTACPNSAIRTPSGDHAGRVANPSFFRFDPSSPIVCVTSACISPDSSLRTEAKNPMPPTIRGPRQRYTETNGVYVTGMRLPLKAGDGLQVRSVF